MAQSAWLKMPRPKLKATDSQIINNKSSLAHLIPRLLPRGNRSGNDCSPAGSQTAGKRSGSWPSGTTGTSHFRCQAPS